MAKGYWKWALHVQSLLWPILLNFSMYHLYKSLWYTLIQVASAKVFISSIILRRTKPLILQSSFETTTYWKAKGANYSVWISLQLSTNNGCTVCSRCLFKMGPIPDLILSPRQHIMHFCLPSKLPKFETEKDDAKAQCALRSTIFVAWALERAGVHPTIFPSYLTAAFQQTSQEWEEINLESVKQSGGYERSN